MKNYDSMVPGTLSEFLQTHDSDASNLSAIAEKSGYFYYYTQRGTAAKILNNSLGAQFWISSLSGMNDKQECEWHEGERDNVFALCFSHARSESIPMWYLYSGIAGEGVRIGITPHKMKGLIEDISCVYPVSGGKVDFKSPLYRGVDFSLDFGWIYYLGKLRIQYNNDTYERQPGDEETIIEFINNSYFVKDYEWNYEKEFRVVFHFFRNPPKKIALLFDKARMTKGQGGLSATMAPELNSVPSAVIASELGLPEKKITKSKLKIQMDLIGRNRSSIINNFEEIVNGIEDEDEIKKMKHAIEIKESCLQETVYVGV